MPTRKVPSFDAPNVVQIPNNHARTEPPIDGPDEARTAVVLPFRPRRGYRHIDVGPCTCGATGEYHHRACPATRVPPEHRMVPWCPWVICAGPGDAGRDCGDCTGWDWRPSEVTRQAPSLSAPEPA